MDRPADLDAELAVELARWRAAGLERVLPDLSESPGDGVDFTSNDVLGLARDPDVLAGARAALEEFGAGGRASRLLGGGSPLDAELERSVATWLDAEAALLFPSGYHANLGVLGALAGPGDVIVSDELNHASLIDAARLARARVLVFRHADAEDAERRLAQARGARRVVLVTESVFSMDGDVAPLADLARACDRHGARLVVDEAHSIGVLGPGGAGAWAATGLGGESVVRIVTGGKALGVAGALVVSSSAVRARLVNRARTFAFTTAAPPAVAGALHAAVPACRAADDARATALRLARRVADELDLAAPAAAVVPILMGSNEAALGAAEALRERGLDVRAVRPPTVPEHSSRLRVVCHAYNTDDEVTRLVEALRELRPAAPSPAAPPRLATPLFVTGTDTDVGKTVVSALLVRAARRAEIDVAYWKPVQSGPEDDSLEVARLAELDPAPTPGYAFGLPASPHEAAAAEQTAVDVAHLTDALAKQRTARPGGLLVCEPAGGLHVPLTDDTLQSDWLAELRPPLVLVARSGLGTLNHTLLSLEALRARHLEPRALFLVGPLHASNARTLRASGGVAEVFEVPHFDALDAAALDGWLDAHDLSRVVRA